MAPFYEDPLFQIREACSGCDRLEWLRPWQIVERPVLVDSDQSAKSLVIQGNLCNCWFAASLIGLQSVRSLFEFVVPRNQSLSPRDGGIYDGSLIFRFWHYTRWINIKIDDRLPTQGGRLVFMRNSNSNEFWAALVEKAYAKMHGTYNVFDGGLTCQALTELTGGFCDDLSLGSIHNLHNILKRAITEEMILVCSADQIVCSKLSESCGDIRLENRKFDGIDANHIYAVTVVNQMDGLVLYIENPCNTEDSLGIMEMGDDKYFKRKFEMSLAEFEEKFDSFGVCRIVRNAIVFEQVINSWLSKFGWRGQWLVNVSDQLSGCDFKLILALTQMPKDWDTPGHLYYRPDLPLSYIKHIFFAIYRCPDDDLFGTEAEAPEIGLGVKVCRRVAGVPPHWLNRSTKPIAGTLGCGDLSLEIPDIQAGRYLISARTYEGEVHTKCVLRVWLCSAQPTSSLGRPLMLTGPVGYSAGPSTNSRGSVSERAEPQVLR